MSKIYNVTLTEEERQTLLGLVSHRSEKSSCVKRAYILLSADENGEQKWTDEKISKAYRVSLRTIERTRQRFVMESLDIAIFGKKRTVFREKILDGEVEAHLIALRCSEPPEGYAKWSLQLLADKMVELNYVEHISHESVRQLLKKTNLNLGRLNRG